MVLKTFNLDEKTYKKFSKFCKENGISMSKQVNIFIESQIEKDPEVRKDYLNKLERIRKGGFIRIGSADDFAERYQQK